jgi:ubiquitin C-terminal hydrolase
MTMVMGLGGEEVLSGSCNNVSVLLECIIGTCALELTNYTLVFWEGWENLSRDIAGGYEKWVCHHCKKRRSRHKGLNIAERKMVPQLVLGVKFLNFYHVEKQISTRQRRNHKNSPKQIFKNTAGCWWLMPVILVT